MCVMMLVVDSPAPVVLLFFFFPFRQLSLPLSQPRGPKDLKGTPIKGRLIRCGPAPSSSSTYAQPIIDEWLIPATIVVGMDAFFSFATTRTTPLPIKNGPTKRNENETFFV